MWRAIEKDLDHLITWEDIVATVELEREYQRDGKTVLNKTKQLVCKWLHSGFIYFLHSAPTFLESGFYIAKSSSSVMWRHDPWYSYHTQHLTVSPINNIFPWTQVAL